MQGDIDLHPQDSELPQARRMGRSTPQRNRGQCAMVDEVQLGDLRLGRSRAKGWIGWWQHRGFRRSWRGLEGWLQHPKDSSQRNHLLCSVTKGIPILEEKVVGVRLWRRKREILHLQPHVARKHVQRQGRRPQGWDREVRHRTEGRRGDILWQVLRHILRRVQDIRIQTPEETPRLRRRGNWMDILTLKSQLHLHLESGYRPFLEEILVSEYVCAVGGFHEVVYILDMRSFHQVRHVQERDIGVLLSMLD